MDLRVFERHVTARILGGRPVPLVGRLLADTTRAGELVMLDPTTGGEVSTIDDRPAFILSTEGEASDGNIVRQHWDLSRAEGPGIPVLWGHDQDELLGQWQDLTVTDIGSGRVLVGRCYLDPGSEDAQERRGQIKRGVLRSVSVGWIPGASTRRGDLPATDPLYREPTDDWCGMPGEGLVMGTPEQPNRLVECSLVSCPADPNAIVTARVAQRGMTALERGLRGEQVSRGDEDAMLAYLAGLPQVRTWIGRLIDEHIALRGNPSSPPPPSAARTLGELLRG